MLEGSRAEHLALNGIKPDCLGERLAEDLDRAHERLVETETRLDALHDEYARTRWYQRSRRAGVMRVTDGWQRDHDHWQGEIARLTNQLEQRPDRHEPKLRRGGDPLAALEPAPGAERELRHSLDRVHERDVGLEL